MDRQVETEPAAFADPVDADHEGDELTNWLPTSESGINRCGAKACHADFAARERRSIYQLLLLAESR